MGSYYKVANYKQESTWFSSQCNQELFQFTSDAPFQLNCLLFPAGWDKEDYVGTFHK